MNLQHYQPEIRVRSKSMLTGETDTKVHHSELPEIPVIREWLADDDLQEITVISTNIGFVKTFTKQFSASAGAV